MAFDTFEELDAYRKQAKIGTSMTLVDSNIIKRVTFLTRKMFSPGFKPSPLGQKGIAQQLGPNSPR